MCKSLDKNSGLDSHVQTPSNASTLERLILSILFTSRHQSRHFILSKFNLFSTECCKTQIRNLELRCRRSHICGGGAVRGGVGCTGRRLYIEDELVSRMVHLQLTEIDNGSFCSPGILILVGEESEEVEEKYL